MTIIILIRIISNTNIDQDKKAREGAEGCESQPSNR